MDDNQVEANTKAIKESGLIETEAVIDDDEINFEIYDDGEDVEWTNLRCFKQWLHKLCSWYKVGIPTNMITNQKELFSCLF